jgi:tetratricopeptide (TPR) repeat protein
LYDGGVVTNQTKIGWTTSHNLFNAVDLVAEAIVTKDFISEDAFNAAQFINRNPKSSWFMTKLANHYLEGTAIDAPELKTVETYQLKISKIRSFLDIYPGNPVAWSDLALSYATLGLRTKATKSMAIALQLGENNRFVLRSAAGCFIFNNEPDRAIHTLNKSDLGSIDPWIASAIVAIADGYNLKSRHLRTAKALSGETGLSDFSRSELNASLATMEIKSGSNKEARRLFKRSLIDPTENALAQAEYMKKAIGLDSSLIDDGRKKVYVPFEANTIRYYFEGKYRECLEAANSWASFDSINPDPVIISSFVASTCLEDAEGAIDIIMKATPAQKENLSVANNMIFSLIEKGELRKGVYLLNKLDISVARDDVKLMLKATRGFAAFRSNRPEYARELYRKAITGFKDLGDNRSAAIAKYFLAREEKRLASDYAEALADEVKEEVKRYEIPTFNILAQKL